MAEKWEGKLPSSISITIHVQKLYYSSAYGGDYISTWSYFRFTDMSTFFSVGHLDSYHRIFIFNYLMN